MTRFLAKTRFLASSRNRSGHWFGRIRTRGEAASIRLHAAHVVFDDSIVALRKAALDHVDCQDLASTALRANLARIARRMEVAG